MYSSPGAFILGFHGCDRKVGEAILSGKVRHLKKSENDYDWLADGIYFWENNPDRALQFAEELKARPRRGKARITDPFVIGAIIDPGHCLNLMDARSLELVRLAYESMRETFAKEGTPLPVNKPEPGTGELLRRNLDCAVIKTLHQLRADQPGARAFDAVRGVFQEGDELFPGAGILDKNHIQICVRSMSCIRGYFRVLPDSA